MDLRQLNKYQTPITDELLKTLPQEVSDELFELVNTVPYIERLIKPDRKYARDLDRDEQGRIIVDLLNPHILEDMDYFRPSALHFKQHGCYTKLRPNSSPNSEFGKWLKEEVRRSWYGYVRESDGEWVTGDMYFYLNYCPIVQTKIKRGTKKADRVVDFPEVWEGIYLRFHYMHQASHGGLYNNFVGGQHGAEIAKRGCSKSYTMASILAKIFILGENSESCKNIRGVVTAYQKEYLTKDGTLNKFIEMIDFCAEHTQFPSKRLKSSMQEMTWKMGYIDTDKGINKGTLNEVIGVSSKDDSDKLRGKRALRIFIEEFGNFRNISDIHRVLLPSVQEGDIAFGQLMYCGTGGSEDSDFSGALEMMYNPKGFNLYALPNIYDKNSQGKSSCIYFFPAYLNRKPHQNENGVSDVIAAIIELLLDRYKIKYNTSDPIALTRTKAENPCTIQEAVMKRDSTIYPVTDLIDVDNELSLNPRILDQVATGTLKIDGSGKVTYSPDHDSSPIREFPHKDNKLHGSIEFFEMPVIDQNTNRPYSQRYIAGCLKEGEMVNTELGLKKCEEIKLTDKLINIEGVPVKIKNLQVYNNLTPVYKVKLANIYNTTTFSEEHPIYCSTGKQKYHGRTKVKAGLAERYYEYNFDFRIVKDLKVNDIVKSPNFYRKVIIPENKWVDNSRIDRQIENPILNKDFWWFVGLMLGDGWAAKNKNISIAFNIKEQFYINKAIAIAENIFHRKLTLRKTHGNGVEYSMNNLCFWNFFKTNFGIGAKNKQIPEWVKYLPYDLKQNLIFGYLASDGSVTNSGIEFVSISNKLLCDIQDILLSLGVICSHKLLRPASEHHFGETVYNTQPAYSLLICKSYVSQMLSWGILDYKILTKYKDRDYANHCKRNMWFSDDLKYIFIRVVDIQTEEYVGKIYNYECETHTFMCNYIPTHNCDPYDDDASTTLSLGSILILDTWTDTIVAEYTGRPTFADDFYEMCRRLLIFYNAKANYENNKKGLFSYFSRMNSLYLLTDTLEFLKDKEMVKGELYGNKIKGSPSTDPIKKYGRTCIRGWLLKPRTTIIEVDGQEVETSVPQLKFIKNKALIKELVLFNLDGNFDRHDALVMLMLLREDFLRYCGNESPSERNHYKDKDYLGNDQFFEKNYRHKKEKHSDDWI